MNRKELTDYITETYSVQPDFPFMQYPDVAVFRHENNRKWFAVIMNVQKGQLGMKGDGAVDIVNLKCDPILSGSLRNEKGYYPALYEKMGLVEDYNVLYNDAMRNDLFEVLIIFSAFGALFNLITFCFYDLTENKHRAYVSVLEIRAMFENYTHYEEIEERYYALASEKGEV